jgi:hypothetical protein
VGRRELCRTRRTRELMGEGTAGLDRGTGVRHIIRCLGGGGHDGEGNAEQKRQPTTGDPRKRQLKKRTEKLPLVEEKMVGGQ